MLGPVVKMRNKPELPAGNQCLVITPEALRSSYSTKLSVRLARALAPEGSQARARLDSFIYIITYTHNKHVARAVVDAQVRLAVRLRDLLKSNRVTKEELQQMLAPLRRGMSLVSSVLDIYKERLDLPAHKTDAYTAMAADCMALFHQTVLAKLDGSLTHSDKKHLNTVFGVFASHQFYECALSSADLRDHVADIEQLVDRYLAIALEL